MSWNVAAAEERLVKPMSDWNVQGASRPRERPVAVDDGGDDGLDRKSGRRRGPRTPAGRQGRGHERGQRRADRRGRARPTQVTASSVKLSICVTNEATAPPAGLDLDVEPPEVETPPGAPSLAATPESCSWP